MFWFGVKSPREADTLDEVNVSVSVSKRDEDAFRGERVKVVLEIRNLNESRIG